MSEEADFPISAITLKLVKRYLPDMGISLPLDGDKLYHVYDNLYDMEVSYAMEADDLMRKNGNWEPVEAIANMFAHAADELSDYEDSENVDLALLSRKIEEQVITPNDVFPAYPLRHV